MTIISSYDLFDNAIISCGNKNTRTNNSSNGNSILISPHKTLIFHSFLSELIMILYRALYLTWRISLKFICN